MTQARTSTTGAVRTTQGNELDRLLAMDLVIGKASPAALAEMPVLQAAMERASAIEQLRGALTDDIMRRFLPLMNTSLGFRTDRPNRRNDSLYSEEEVRSCMIEALLIGLRLTDNEWNIISGRCYVTREGFTRLLREHPGLTDLKIGAGLPRGDPAKGVVIPYTCSWRLNGQEQTLTAEIPVRGGEHSTVDQLLGKGDRKIKARVWAKITGSEVSPDGEVDLDTDTPQKPDPRPSTIQTDLAAMKAEQASRQAAETPPEPAKAAQEPPAPEPAPKPEAASRGIGDADAEPPSDWKPTPAPPAPSPPWVKKPAGN